MSKPVILCVDDENFILTSLRDQLTHHLGNEYTIEIAESGEEALELLEELLEEGIEIPLIISDQIMPGIKGDELLIKIHGRYPNALKIFLTGQANAAAVGNAVNNANLYRYIAKPWDEADLKLTVTKALYSYTRDKQISEQNKLLEKLYAQAQKEIAERKRVESLLAEANQTLEQKVKERTKELSRTLDDLKATQSQLIIQEKMASLGMLTSGIAHEIKNPLNFINSFSALSVDLTRELKELIDSQKNNLSPEMIEMIDAFLTDLQSNAASINEEGRRADSIIRSMLTHSLKTDGQPRETDLNSLLGEAVNLACHSMRGKDAYFDISIETDYAPDLEPLQIIPQDISRVFVNLVNNAYYATREKKKTLEDSYIPVLKVRTMNREKHTEIRIRDNGTGIPQNLLPEIFNPFFTTKPSGEGAGLGLSISYDIVVQGHRGTISVDTFEGEYTEFIISLPK
ncbi:MAG: response regulator [Desulfobacteraceae bacterium]|nr:response regulator [Desulfobacteraceae bacterium]